MLVSWAIPDPIKVTKLTDRHHIDRFPNVTDEVVNFTTKLETDTWPLPGIQGTASLGDKVLNTKIGLWIALVVQKERWVESPFRWQCFCDAGC